NPCEQMRVYLPLPRARVELKTARGFFLAAGRRKDQGTVPSQEFISRQFALRKSPRELLMSRVGPYLRWAVFLAHEDIADALLQFTDIASPFVVGARVLYDPGLDLLR